MASHKLSVSRMKISERVDITSNKKTNKTSTKNSDTDRDTLYRASGTAPPPSKDFSELVVSKKNITWRKWRIKYSKDGKLKPSEEKLPIEEFLDRDIIQMDISRMLGEEVLHMAIGTITKCWLPRLPMKALQSILSSFTIQDICRMQRVSGILLPLNIFKQNGISAD